MSDKLRSAFPIAVEFAEGELPTDKKLNGLARQARSGQSLIEFALGDVWNDGGDQFLQLPGISENALMIPSVGRYLGATKHTNPLIPYLPDITEYVHDFGDFSVYLDGFTYQYFLPFLPVIGSSYSWSGTVNVPTTEKLSKGDVEAPGDWWWNVYTGEMFFNDAIDSSWKFTYKPVINGDLGQNTEYNVIPDPDTEPSGFLGCKIAYANGSTNVDGYIVYLPPRGPLHFTRFPSSHLRRYPQKSFNNRSSTPNSGEKLFWQRTNVDASTTAGWAEHYRYNLPTIITDSWSAGAQFPRGVVQLWDHSQTGTFIQNVTLRAEAGTARTWAFIVSGTAMDTWVNTYGDSIYPVGYLTTGANDHSKAYYPAAGLRVVSTGNSVSKSLYNLALKSTLHEHTGRRLQSQADFLPESPIDHSIQFNHFDPLDLQTTFISAIDFGEFFFKVPPSKLRYDDHAQYLHRGGSSWGLLRDRYWGGMFGDLYMMSIDSTNNHNNLDDDSRRIVFGDPVFGPSIRYQKSSLNPTESVTVAGQDLKVDLDTYSIGYKQNAVNDGVFAWSGAEADGWGKVRAHYLPPTEWAVFIQDGASDFTIPAGGGVPTTPQRFYDTQVANKYGYGPDSSSPTQLSLYIDGPTSSLTPAYAFAFPQIPFTHYGIVGVQMTWRQLGLPTLTVPGLFSLGIGRQIPATLSGAMIPGFDIDLHDEYGDINQGVYAQDRLILSTGTGQPFGEVDHFNYTDQFFLRIKVAGGGGGAQNLEVMNVIVYYRVKEL